jgi:hypothetical protein
MLERHVWMGNTAGGRRERDDGRVVAELFRGSSGRDDAPIPARVVHYCDLARRKSDSKRRVSTVGGHSIHRTRQNAPRDVKGLQCSRGVLVGRTIARRVSEQTGFLRKGTC